MFSKILAPSVEKVPYRSPKSQELVQFRKAIENDMYETVQTTIWENPRFLIGSGDTPSILKEGTRYNAIHVAALHNKAKICEMILETISKPHFIQLLHGKKNYETCQDVSNILLDLYLNMPEKGRSDTPLHLAVKYGHIDVVEILTSYHQCKMLKNLVSAYPRDVICTRSKDMSQGLHDAILSLLQERFYVPVIRSVDSSMAPIIGEPFTPQSPPVLRVDPLSPEMEIKAYAGPMDKEQAQVFRKRWKTPPRVQNNSSFSSPIKMNLNSSSLINNNNSSTPIISKKSLFRFNDTDLDNNLKDNNSNHVISTTTMDSPLRLKFLKYRERVLSSASSPSSDDTVNMLNDSPLSLSLLSDVFDQEESFKVRHLKLTDTEKGLETVGRTLARESNVGWKEYWDFLGSFVNFNTIEGLEELEQFLRNNLKKNTPESTNKIEDTLTKLCSTLSKLNFRKTPPSPLPSLSSTSSPPLLTDIVGDNTSTTLQLQTPYQCVEKSCQIYAQNINKIITNNVNNIIILNERIGPAIERFQRLVVSYRSDVKFSKINFIYVHSRFSNLIVFYLMKERLEENAYKWVSLSCFFLVVT